MSLYKAQYLNQYDFSGGIDISKPSYLISDKSCFANVDSYDGTVNCFWDSGIKRRKGSIKLNATQALTGKIINGTRFYRSSAPNKTTIVAIDDGTNVKIYYLSSSLLWTEITGGTAIPTGSTIDFAKWKDNLYIATGSTVLQVISYSGSWAKADITGLTNYPSIVTLHKDRLWVAGGDMSVGSLQCTGYEVDNSWAAGTGEAFNVGFRDGDPIVNLVGLGNNLIIYKQDSLWRMQGDNLNNWFQAKSQASIGASARNSIVDVGYGHIFLAADNIYFYDGETLIPVGNNIKPWLDLIPISLRKNAVACYHDSYYSISFAKSKSIANNDFELMLDLKEFKGGSIAWWANDGRNNVAYITYDGPDDDMTLNYCDMVNTNLYQMVTGDRDYDDVLIKMEMQTKHFIFGEPNIQKNFGRLKVDCATGVGSFQINLLKNTNNEWILPLNVNTFASGGATFGTAIMDTSYFTSESNARTTFDIALPSELDAYALAYKINYSEDKSKPYFYGFSIEFKEKSF